MKREAQCLSHAQQQGTRFPTSFKYAYEDMDDAPTSPARSHTVARSLENAQRADGSIEPRKIHIAFISVQHAERLKAARRKDVASLSQQVKAEFWVAPQHRLNLTQLENHTVRV